ncbi:MAG: hypothetical protein K2X82_03395 [Gemmataceae bacterium]|nr:hypothetical protein [Gemmataceae bacterium]
MPITFPCSCGKTLRVKDEYVGRRVQCPVCRGAALVPAAPPLPDFEVVDDPPAPPPVPRAKAVPVEDEPEFRVVVDAPSQDDRPRWRRRDRGGRDGRDDYDDRDDGRPRRRKKKPKPDEQPSHFALERKVLNGGVAGGVLAMAIAVVWFVAGLFADILFYYPPFLFVFGLIAFVRGLAGGSDE